MVICEKINDKLCRHYSDENYYIQKIGTGETYSEAVDLISSEFEYAETDILIDEKEVI